MQVLRMQHAQIEVVTEDRGIIEGDYVQVHIEQVEGPNQPAGFKPESHLFRVGDKPQFYGLTLDEAVLGKKKGEAMEVSQEGTGTARGTVQAIKQKVLPELDDEFAKDLGDYKTLAELREKVGTQLEQGLKRDIEETYKDQNMKQLEQLHNFDIPESLVQRELDAMVQSERTRRRRIRHLMSHGEAGHQEEETLDVRKFREESLPTAQQRVKLGLVLETIAQKEGLAVTEADLEYECRQMARALQVDVAEVVKMLQAGGADAVEDLKSRILVEKAVYDTSRYVKPAIATICVGQAASMGALLLAAGTKGKRYALPNSRIMIHQPRGGFEGQATDIGIQAEEIIKIRKRLDEIMAKHASQSVEKVHKDSERDYFMSAEEAKAYGLIDEVIVRPPKGLRPTKNDKGGDGKTPEVKS